MDQNAVGCTADEQAQNSSRGQHRVLPTPLLLGSTRQLLYLQFANCKLPGCPAVWLEKLKASRQLLSGFCRDQRLRHPHPALAFSRRCFGVRSMRSMSEASRMGAWYAIR